MDDGALRALFNAIASADAVGMHDLLDATPGLARVALRAGATREAAPENYLTVISHYVYAGDTALHVAAAAHRPEIARTLIGLGADVAAKNRRGATPLHYAADGTPGLATWRPEDQAATIAVLVAAGANPDALDMNGVAPLHRAVRTRCAAAVAALLEGGADAGVSNGKGSTPMMLATRQTGRGRSGSPEAKDQQAEIVRLLEG